VAGLVPEEIVDLQTHSTHSDGTCTPQEIVELAAEKGLQAVALTDHDTLDGVDAFQAAGNEHGVETVPGVELSVRIAREDIDVLGYFVDPDDATLQDVCETAREHRAERAPKMLDRLGELGMPVDLDAVQAKAGGEAVGRPHVAQAMVAAGHVDTVDEAFEEYIGDDGPAYVPKERLDADVAVDAIHSAGGVAVLAHPCFVHPATLPTVLDTLLDAGLDGIEVWYSEHDTTHEQFFAQQADKHGLVKTGGSDFHGSNKPYIALGEGRGDLQVSYEVVEHLRERRERLHG
jgi:predicted metal-dependent phosphoesterase TrpH